MAVVAIARVGHHGRQIFKYREKCQVKKHDFLYITPGRAKFGFERGVEERCLLCPHLIKMLSCGVVRCSDNVLEHCSSYESKCRALIDKECFSGLFVFRKKMGTVDLMDTVNWVMDEAGQPQPPSIFPNRGERPQGWASPVRDGRQMKRSLAISR